MISCRDAAELIPLHVGDDLPGEEAARIEEHLEGCALCNAEYSSFASAREALVALREDVPVGSLWAGVSASIGGDASASKPLAALLGAGRPRRQPRWAIWSSLAAAAALAIAFLPPYFGAHATPPGSGEGAVSADAPMIQRTTQEELNNFLLRSGVRILPESGGEEFLPQATPAAAQPGVQPPRRHREPAKIY